MIVRIELNKAHIAGMGQFGDHSDSGEHFVNFLDCNDCAAIGVVFLSQRGHVMDDDHMFSSGNTSSE